MKTIFHRFSKPRHHLRFMSRMTINNQKHRPLGSLKQSFDEINKLNCSYPSLDRHETEFPLGADCRDQVQSKPCPGAADHRSLAFHRPGGTGMMVRTHPRLIPKEDQRLLLTGQPLDSGILFLQPALDFLRLLLVCTPDRTLWGQSQLVQQTTHRSLAELDAKSLIDKLPNHFGRPKGEGELQLQRIFVSNGLVDPSKRRAIQFRCPASTLLGIQGTPTAMSISRQPAVHRYPVDSQGLSNHFRTLSVLYASDRPFAQFGQRLMISLRASVVFMDAIVTTN